MDINWIEATSWIQTGGLATLIISVAWTLIGYIKGQEKRIDHVYEMILEEQRDSNKKFQEMDQKFYHELREMNQRMDQRFHEVDEKFYDLLKEAKAKS